MTIQEEFTQILETESLAAITPFLKKLEPVHKKALVPFLKKKIKEYNKIEQTGTNTWASKKTILHGEIFIKTGLVCLNFKEYSKLFWHLEPKIVDEILTWHTIPWLEDLVNSHGEREYITPGLTYEWVVKKQLAGVFIPSNSLIMKLLPYAIYKTQNHREYTYVPQKLSAFEITLKTHFWLFFQYESNIYHAGRWISFKNKKEDKKVTWQDTIIHLSQKKKLSRTRLLKECLQASTRNFNRNLIGWYIDLFLKLEPTQAELMDLQTDLFQVMYASQSKAINAVLKIFKTLVKTPDFENQAFLEHAPITLVSDIKSVVTSTLMIVEKIIQKDKKNAAQILVLACQAFLHNDAAIQTRLAKLITKYGDSKCEDLTTEINNYQDNLLVSTQQLLKDFLSKEENTIVEDDLIVEKTPMIGVTNKIQALDNFDDFVFLASQVLDGNEAWHFDLFAAGILAFQADINSENINKLEPAFQRAYKLLMARTWKKSVGQLDELLATFIYNLAQFLIKDKPNLTSHISTLDKKYRKKGLKDEWLLGRLKALGDWKFKTIKDNKKEADNVYIPFRVFLEDVLEKFKNKDPLPLISTPTHKPYWIDPVILVERLSAYQEAKKRPHTVDWQIAISRTALEDTSAAIKLAKNVLTGELLEMTLFLLEKDSMPQSPFTYEAEWLVTALAKPNKVDYAELEDFPHVRIPYKTLMGAFDWTISQKQEVRKIFNYKTRMYDTKTVYNTKLEVESFKKEIIQKVFLEGDSPRFVNFTPIPSFFIYQHLLWDKYEDFWYYDTPNANDIPRILSSCPNNMEVMIGQLLRCNFNYGTTFWEEESKAAVIKILETILPEWRGGGEMLYLFMTNTLICSDKSARSLAAEIWIKGVSESSMNNPLLGRMLGKEAAFDFYPLKRLTDLIKNELMHISAKHHQALETIIETMIPLLPDVSIRNTKTLLEIYAELLSLNQSKIESDVVLKKLEIWKVTNNLKKAVQNCYSN